MKRKIYLAIPYTGYEELSFDLANIVAAELIKEGQNDNSEEYTNLILSHYLKELEVTPEQLLRFINKYVDDGFLLDTYDWLEKHQNLSK